MCKTKCCDECHRRIGMRSVSASRLWLDFCDQFTRQGIFNFYDHSVDSSELRILETMGYIVSSENRENILIKLLGVQQDYNGDLIFCTGDCE